MMERVDDASGVIVDQFSGLVLPEDDVGQELRVEEANSAFAVSDLLEECLDRFAVFDGDLVRFLLDRGQSVGVWFSAISHDALLGAKKDYPLSESLHQFNATRVS